MGMMVLSLRFMPRLSVDKNGAMELQEGHTLAWLHLVLACARYQFTRMVRAVIPRVAISWTWLRFIREGNSNQRGLHSKRSAQILKRHIILVKRSVKVSFIPHLCCRELLGHGSQAHASTLLVEQRESSPVRALRL